MSDLHLTSNPRDEYRFDLFPWLANQCQKLKVKNVYILGDLTDAKDYHPSTLVNNVVQAIMLLVEQAELEQLVILRGNHDGINPEWPYFRFLEELPKVSFICEPTRYGDMLFLPHSREPDKDWHKYVSALFNDKLTVLAHMTVSGSESESGTTMADGINAAYFKHTRKTWAGDVHVPQKIGKVEYIGAPYHIRFGDTFDPRCVHINNSGKTTDLHFESPRKIMVDVRGADYEASLVPKPGDHVKVRIHLSRSEYGTWKVKKKEIEEWAKKQKAELISVELSPIKEEGSILQRQHSVKSPTRLFSEFCAQTSLSKPLQKVGESMLGLYSQKE